MFLLLSSVLGFLSVALGAFGAHALKNKLDSDLLDIYHTAVQYHMIHTVVLLVIAILVRMFPDVTLFAWAGWFIFAGMIVFSGSLYVLSLTGFRGLGAITPIGGVLFLTGWALLAISAVKNVFNS